MSRSIYKPMKARSYQLLMLATVAILAGSAFAAADAKAFTRTITDIEDPAVTAKVLDLDVSASRQLGIQAYFARHVANEYWEHSLSGSADSSLTDEQFPKVIIKRNPTVVSIQGELSTGIAQGLETYYDVLECEGSRTTTESPRLEVSLDGFYQSGTSTASGNPTAILTTENFDPWVQPCAFAVDTSTRATQIPTFSSATEAGSPMSAFVWYPGEGDLTTTKDACVPEFCDFTISGSNTNEASRDIGTLVSGKAETNFTLKLRLEYPAGEDIPTPLPPDTMITKSPKSVIKTRSGKARIAIGFKSTGPAGTKFKCRLDKGSFSPCSSPFKRKVGTGKHTFAVASVYGGQTDKSPAVYRWKVKKVK